MIPTLRTRAVAGVLAIGCLASNAQPLAAGTQTSFRAGVNSILLNVTVTDPSHRYITNLGPEDFVVLEDDKPQTITYFRQSDVPLASVLLIDTSASMERAMPVVHEAAIGFVQQLKPGDITAVINFDTRVEIRQRFTAEQGLLERAIRQTVARGATALYDAVGTALQELEKAVANDSIEHPRRRALLLLSDGEDTSSSKTFDGVLEAATRSDIAIYSIGLTPVDAAPSRRLMGSEFVLRQLAQQTGGRSFFPTDVKELSAIYSEIKAELSNQYALVYESSNTQRDGTYRRIAVRVNRPGLVATTRPGYFAHNSAP